jgi:hypothetical protein
MNLVESILRTCKAEEHTNVFKEHGIDGFALKMLNDEDLQMLGVTEEEKRSAILEHANNLLLPAEKPSDLLIDQKYVQLILSQMSAHLLKHMAALSIAVNREDIIVCNIKMNPAVLCLRNCIVSLEKQLDEFESKVTSYIFCVLMC